MKRADFANGVGWASVGSSLWLGLSADRPAPGEPRRFLALSQRTWAYVLGGAGVVAGGFAWSFDRKASDARDDMAKSATEPDLMTAMYKYSEPRARHWAAVEYERLRNRYYLTGGGLLLAGATLWLTDGTSAAAVTFDFAPTPGGGMAFLSGSY